MKKTGTWYGDLLACTAAGILTIIGTVIGLLAYGLAVVTLIWLFLRIMSVLFSH